MLAMLFILMLDLKHNTLLHVWTSLSCLASAIVYSGSWCCLKLLAEACMSKVLQL